MGEDSVGDALKGVASSTLLGERPTPTWVSSGSSAAAGPGLHRLSSLCLWERDGVRENAEEIHEFSVRSLMERGFEMGARQLPVPSRGKPRAPRAFEIPECAMLNSLRGASEALPGARGPTTARVFPRAKEASSCAIAEHELLLPLGNG